MLCTLEDLLARPPMFACVLVPRLVPLLEKLDSSEIANIYSEFANFVHHPWDLPPHLPSPSLQMPIEPDVQSPSSSTHNNLFPALQLTLEGFASKKSDLRILKQHVADAASDILRNIYIHRLEFVPNHKEFELDILSDFHQISITTSAQTSHTPSDRLGISLSFTSSSFKCPIALNLIVPPSKELRSFKCPTPDALIEYVDSYNGTLATPFVDGFSEIIPRSKYSEVSPSVTYEIVSPYFNSMNEEHQHRQIADKAFESKSREALIRYLQQA